MISMVTMSKKKEESKESDKSFLSKPLVDMAMGSYKGEMFQYIAKADCIITSSKGVALYKKDLASDGRIIVATDNHFVFVRTSLLPDIIDCFPDQPEEWVKELLGSVALEA